MRLTDSSSATTTVRLRGASFSRDLATASISPSAAALISSSVSTTPFISSSDSVVFFLAAMPTSFHSISSGSGEDTRPRVFHTAKQYRAPGGTRTHTAQILRLLPLPIGIQGHISTYGNIPHRPDLANRRADVSSRYGNPYNDRGLHGGGPDRLEGCQRRLCGVTLTRWHRRCARRWCRCCRPCAHPARSSGPRSCRHRPPCRRP